MLIIHIRGEHYQTHTDRHYNVYIHASVLSVLAESISLRMQHKFTIHEVAEFANDNFIVDQSIVNPPETNTRVSPRPSIAV